MSTPYNVLVTDRTGTPLAVLDRIVEPRLDIKGNAAALMSFSIPRGDTKLADLTLASYIEIRRAHTRIRRGRVITREITPTHVHITAMTEEGLLLDHALPTKYGMALGFIDLADAVRACLNAWHTQRVKWQSEWNGHVESYRIATEGFNNGVLMLAKDGSNAYHPSGYAVYQFESSAVPDFAGWDRIRWASDYQEPVYTTIQYRFGTTGTWLPDTTITAEDGTILAGTAGGIPDQIGLGLNNDMSGTLQVRCNLYTADTTSEDPGGTNQKGVTPFFHALEVLARRDTGITGTGIPASTGITVEPITSGDVNALQAIRALCEAHEYTFTVDNLDLTLTAKDAGTDMSDQPIITAEDER